MARKLAELPRVVVSAPQYLAQAGRPRTPADLAAHRIVAGPAGQASVWRFERGGTITSVTVEPGLVTTVNEVSIAATVAGLGIMSMTERGCRRELADGSLVRLLDEWCLDNVALSAVFPAGRAAKPSARAFADFVSQLMRS